MSFTPSLFILFQRIQTNTCFTFSCFSSNEIFELRNLLKSVCCIRLQNLNFICNWIFLDCLCLKKISYCHSSWIVVTIKAELYFQILLPRQEALLQKLLQAGDDPVERQTGPEFRPRRQEQERGASRDNQEFHPEVKSATIHILNSQF